jgi:ribosomal protein S12 methylthiotransferase accessory factor
MDANESIHYDMTLTATEASTGFFACIPNPEPGLDTALAWLCSRPMDTFLYRYLLDQLGGLTPAQLTVILRDAPAEAPVVRALLLEAASIYPHLSRFRPKVDPAGLCQLVSASPLITLRARQARDHAVHRRWARILGANLEAHRAVPYPEHAPKPFPYDPADLVDPGGVHITTVLGRHAAPKKPPVPRRPQEETAALALDALTVLELLEGDEMRHESSLSPIGLLHQWRLSLEVDCGRHRFSLSGLQTAYGRGLTLPAARASYTMEIVERCSSFASIGNHQVRGTLRDHPVVYGRHSALSRGPVAPIDPNAFGCDVAYNDEPLHWIEGVQRRGNGTVPVLVPVQSVFLFSNLDEIELYAGGSSTGLASGNTMAEAKLSGLMELIERDGEGTHPFHHSRCFHVTSRDPGIQAQLDDYRSRGIGFQFQDISPPYGIPCCKCFVTDMDGRIAKGTAAHLNGRQAVLSALTETPYPYPYGPPSGPGMGPLPTLLFEELPDYASGDADQDLAIVEALLLANGIEPVYVDITRRDLPFPVVRALLPGFALTADLDPSARLHPRLFANYLALFKEETGA